MTATTNHTLILAAAGSLLLLAMIPAARTGDTHSAVRPATEASVPAAAHRSRPAILGAPDAPVPVLLHRGVRSPASRDMPTTEAANEAPAMGRGSYGRPEIPS
ncbi:MAG: hypothetical protein KDA73_04255 [Rhodobacteraceae bacterium]|nr:hypothetical protein [Paracoccaceae bacterium]